MGEKSSFIVLSIILLIMILLPSYAGAGSITLTTQVTTSAGGDYLNTTIIIKNNGDTAASRVFLTLETQNQNVTTNTINLISPGSNGKWNALIPLPAHSPGTYPLIVRVNYEDPNAYSFQSLTVTKYQREVASYPSEISISTQKVKIKQKGTIKATLSQNSDISRDVKTTLLLPKGIKPETATQSVRMEGKKPETVTFPLQTTSALSGSSYTAYILTEYEDQNTHITTIQTVIVSVESKSYNTKIFIVIFIIFAGISSILGFFNPIKDYFIKLENKKKYLLFIDIIILIIICLVICSYFTPSLIFLKTTATGGDTGSHYYTLEYLKTTLLPHGRVAGWEQGNYAGMPLLTYYFPLPFLIGVILSWFVGLFIAFKIISILCVFLLPLAIYLCLRLMKYPFPTPILGSILSLLFLFHEGNSMWGGNILSTLAGEFSYGLGLCFAIIFLGLLYRGINENKYWVWNAILFCLIGLTHIYALIFVTAASTFFLLKKPFTTSLGYLTKVFITGGLLLSFWLLPLFINLPYTTSYADNWNIDSFLEVIPWTMLPLLILTIGLIIGLLIYLLIGLKRNKPASIDTRIIFFAYAALTSGILFFYAVEIGVVNIRFIPFIQVLLVILSAIAIGITASKYKPKTFFTMLILGLIIITVILTSAKVSPWAQWNYKGFEEKTKWDLFRKINDNLSGDESDPRVVFEHSGVHNAFGTTRAFESLPLFSGRQTLEGLYMQSSLSAPAIFYIQSQVSKEASCPFPNYGCTTTNLTKGLARLQLFNVGQFIVVSDKVKKELRNTEGYTLSATFEDYEIWNVSGVKGYVTVPEYEPVLMITDHPSQQSYLIFVDDELMNVPVVMTKETSDKNQFNQVITDTKDIKKIPLNENCQVETKLTAFTIHFTTTCPGKPHLIKISYYPNWKSVNNENIYRVSPSFMLIIPTKTDNALIYTRSKVEINGIILSLLGILIVIITLIPTKKPQFSQHSIKKIQTSLDKHHLILITFVLILIIAFLTLKGTILHDNQKDELTMRIAIATERYSTCEFAAKNIDRCYIEVGKLTNDYNLCAARVTPTNKDNCYHEIAVYSKNPSICGYINDLNKKEECKKELS